MMYKQRKAFSMITALFVIILMASVAGFVMNLSGKIVQESTAEYQKEQAVLFAKSYTELAIMAVMSNDRNTTNVCVSDIEAINVIPIGASVSNAQGYNVETRIAFIGPNSDIDSCADTRELGNPVTASSDELNIIVDVYVRYKDINHPTPSSAPWITYHRRTLQKI